MRWLLLPWGYRGIQGNGGTPHGLWRGNTCACNMHTFWLRLRDLPGGTSAFDSQRPSTTYGQSQHP
ncbi:unnamed protein product [Acanthoscelides obtectus]|uniref:Uncharacterized protein n=1 Tax=Acanthoscelides obtectus TaxID=200917 RepID=A0A9P0K6E3_ACAOB|nr:unnamed protein product [Acanthoscelides obtectus]CAK1667432.1 hypothetical protein AOBTE_LOCUS25838 [Acanthoscelides obtectus]